MKIIIRLKHAEIVLLSLLFALSFYLRINYIIVNKYPPVFIDYVGHTLSTLYTLENFWTLFYPYTTQAPKWFRGTGDFLADNWWFQINPPLSYVLGDLLVSPFVLDVQVGWVCGSLFFSLSIFSIYYFVYYFLKDRKTAIIACLFYATCAGDLLSITKGKFMHALAISIYPLLVTYTHKIMKKFDKKNFAILVVLFWATINAFTIYVGVYILGLLAYYLITKRIKGLRYVVLGIVVSSAASIPFLIRFLKSYFTRVFGHASFAPLITLVNINLLMDYFPHDSFGVITYNLIALPVKLLAAIFVFKIVYDLIKRKNENMSALLFFFLGPLIFYLLQYAGFASYPRRILYQTPQLFAIAGAIGLSWIAKQFKKNQNTVILLAIIFVLLGDFVNYTLALNYAKPKRMSDARYEAIAWIRNNILENETLYFLNSYNDLGFSEWASFTYREHVFANETLSHSLIAKGEVYQELLNYKYIIVNDILSKPVVSNLAPILEKYNYTLKYYNGEVGVFVKNA